MDNANYASQDRAIRAAIAEKEARGSEMNKCHGASRELTVAEHLDAKIEAADRQVRALRDLKASLPGSFLNSGVSRIAGLSGV